MNLVKSSLKYPSVALFMAFLLLCTGLYAFFTMPKTEDPSITIRTGLVIASYPGATTEEVEKQVTKVLEKHIFKYQEVYKAKTYSTSRPGIVIINVELEDSVKNADLFWAELRHEMNEAAFTELPRGVRGVMVVSDFGDTVAMLIAVHGENYTYAQLKDYADRIQDEMRTVREVGKLALYGDKEEQIRITGDLKRMAQFSVTPSAMIQTVQARNVTGAAGTLDTDTTSVPVKTNGEYASLDDIRNTLINVSPTGQPLYVRDIADVTRTYEDSDFKVRYDGKPCVIISVEMQKGNNIVKLGESLSGVFDRLNRILPPDIKLDLIADQPQVVSDRMESLTHEFLLAIASVIIVTIILLPIRVALIAALAIPVTLLTTIAVMNFFDIALHQVSIASLILVLGIVVDDAIVIADNYVDLLDRKVTGEEVGWRAVGEVLIPVLTATVTIICAFLPMLILTGSVGEFIQALPLTVTIALTTSFIVATMLTPIICRFFIKKGLHSETKEKKFSLLDSLQSMYGQNMRFFMRYKSLAITIGIVSFACGLYLYMHIPQEFFPSAERNQFTIDVWMPQGTKTDSTDEAVASIENILKDTSGVKHYASFIGQSAPRFYYNVNPQQPDTAYAQIIVNTESVEATKKLVGSLSGELDREIPEALVLVKELQQGQQMEAPIEVRISGYDLPTLKKTAEDVSAIMRKVPYSRDIYTNYFNDSGMADVQVNNELANRLGVTNYGVSGTLDAALDGQIISIYHEGDRTIPIIFRLPEDKRKSFGDISDSYVASSVTGKGIAVKAFADIRPEWQTSRLVRRNGVRTITINAFIRKGHYASEMLNEIRPEIERLNLPEGYKISYGGENSNQEETMPQMIKALGISLLAIFIVMLVQFRNFSEPLIVMSSIPLSILGAMAGLFITGNPFGFTAFMGVISLSGIVVRNSIILVDYIKDRIAEGHPIELAAMEAGQRRLRPIFLTTMAAAVGVIPMILSGSTLWSPLASVMAVGLIFSMFFTLLVVPVLYVIVMTKKSKNITAAVIALFLLAPAAHAGTINMTLEQALAAAMENSRVIKIAKARIDEAEGKLTGAQADYFPQVRISGSYTDTLQDNLAVIPAGDLGSVAGFSLPASDYDIDSSGGTAMAYGIIAQPLTQLLRIKENVGAANADKKISEADMKKARSEIAYAVKNLYYGLLIADAQKSAAQAGQNAAQLALKEAQDGVNSGSVLNVAVIEARAALLQSRQNLMAAQNSYENYNEDLNTLTGQPAGTVIVPSEVTQEFAETASRREYMDMAAASNPDVLAAKETLAKARHGQKAAVYEYIPDVTLFAADIYTDGVSYLNDNITVVGVKMDWNILDWGKKRGNKISRDSQAAQASQNLLRVREQTKADIIKAYNRIRQTEQMTEVAGEALKLSEEQLRINADRYAAGVISEAAYAKAQAYVEKARAESIGAELNYLLAIDNIDKLTAK